MQEMLGKIKVCEICNNSGYLRCQICLHAFYCSKTHKDNDYATMHKFLCPLFQKYYEMMSPNNMLQEIGQRIFHRTEILEFKKAIVSEAIVRCFQLTFQSNKKAYSTSIKIFQICQQIFEDKSNENLILMLILAEIKLKSQDFDTSGAYLALVRWLSADLEQNHIIHFLCFYIYGMYLFSAKHNFQNARRCLGISLFHLWKEKKNSNILEIFPMLILSEIFEADNDILTAASLWDQCLLICEIYLNECLDAETKESIKFENPHGISILIHIHNMLIRCRQFCVTHYHKNMGIYQPQKQIERIKNINDTKLEKIIKLFDYDMSN